MTHPHNTNLISIGPLHKRMNNIEVEQSFTEKEKIPIQDIDESQRNLLENNSFYQRNGDSAKNKINHKTSQGDCKLPEQTDKLKL